MSETTVKSAYPDLAPPPDLELTVMRMLVARFPAQLSDMPDGRDRVMTMTPSDLGERIGRDGHFVRVSDIGAGGGRNRLAERAHIDVDVFAKTRNAARDLGVAIQTFLEGYPHAVKVGSTFVHITEVITLMRPQRVAWADETIRRYYS
ncbi:MAG TPA: hypothetical protein VFX41_07835, partial [Actinomycetales bacterium]|nr:hypothetical protein [Actinomycetales bacterium]